MASLRQIRQRIKSIQNSKQIMRAMQLVSGSKLKRAQDRLFQGRDVLEFLDGLLQRILASTQGLEHPLCAKRDAQESALVIFTSDTGLCGSYNTNLIHLAEAHLTRDAARPTHIIYIGKKGYRYFTKRGFEASDSYVDLAGRPNAARADAIGKALMDRFITGQVSSIKLLYSKYISAMVYKPTLVQWLPVTLEQANRPTGQLGNLHDYLFEPSAKQIFENLLPRWALAKFQLVMLEAFTSEHSARMIAMKNATDNATEIMDALTQQRNRIRQAAITTELSEIVGTAEALK